MPHPFSIRLARPSVLSAALALLMAGACGRTGGTRTPPTPAASVTAPSGQQTPPAAGVGLTAPPAASPAAAGADTPTESAGAGEQDWARQALQILDTVDAAVSDYHDATKYPQSTAMYQQLQQQAFDGFNRALAASDTLWPATQRVKDGSVRDQFVFVMGNIGGFMHPTPDLPGDAGVAGTLGDRIARSLQNAVLTAATVRPKLERLASGH